LANLILVPLLLWFWPDLDKKRTGTDYSSGPLKALVMGCITEMRTGFPSECGWFSRYVLFGSAILAMFVTAIGFVLTTTTSASLMVLSWLDLL